MVWQAKNCWFPSFKIRSKSELECPRLHQRASPKTKFSWREAGGGLTPPPTSTYGQCASRHRQLGLRHQYSTVQSFNFFPLPPLLACCQMQLVNKMQQMRLLSVSLHHQLKSVQLGLDCHAMPTKHMKCKTSFEQLPFEEELTYNTKIRQSASMWQLFSLDNSAIPQQALSFIQKSAQTQVLVHEFTITMAKQ